MKTLKDTSRVKVETDGFFVVKKYKNLSREENKTLMGKLERIDDLKQIKGFVVPSDYSLKNGTVNEIYTKYLNLPDFFSNNDNLFEGLGIQEIPGLPFFGNQLLSDNNSKKFDLETISKCFTNLNETLKEGHKNGVVFLDFASKGNLKYNPKTFQTYILDYEDCQIGNNRAFTWSLPLEKNPVTHSRKYRKGIIWNKNADIFLMTLRWFSMCTSIDLESFLGPDETMNMMGLDDSEIRRKIKLCYDSKKENEYYDDDFMRICSSYDIEEDSDDYGRCFVKKN